MHTKNEIIETFIGLIGRFDNNHALTPSEQKLFYRYADEYFTYYADDAEGKDIE